MRTFTGRRPISSRLLILPALGFVILMTQVPLVVTLVTSALSWIALRPKDVAFIGFDNFVRALMDPKFLSASGNTALITAWVVALSLILGTALALLLNRRFPGRAIARTLALTPFLIVPIAAALFWKHAILNPNYGSLNGAIEWLNSTLGWHLATPSWLTEFPIPAIIGTLVWQWTPFMMLIVLAGLQGLDQAQTEAARIDGAGAVRLFTSIVLPQLRPYLELGVIFGTMYILQVYDVVFTFTSGSSASANLPYMVYQTFYIAGNYGYASALGVVVVIASLVLAIFGLRSVSSLYRQQEAAS